MIPVTPAAALRATALGALVAAAALGPAKAEEERHFLLDTAGDLSRLCGTPTDSPLYGAAIHMCHGYLLGVHHFHEALSAGIEESVYCIAEVDPAPTRDEVTAAFVAWIDANPAAAETEALDGLLQWASQAYPCQ